MQSVARPPNARRALPRCIKADSSPRSHVVPNDDPSLYKLDPKKMTFSHVVGEVPVSIGAREVFINSTSSRFGFRRSELPLCPLRPAPSKTWAGDPKIGDYNPKIISVLCKFIIYFEEELAPASIRPEHSYQSVIARQNGVGLDGGMRKIIFVWSHVRPWSHHFGSSRPSATNL
jgi:hypothetical protein